MRTTRKLPSPSLDKVYASGSELSCVNTVVSFHPGLSSRSTFIRGIGADRFAGGVMALGSILALFSSSARVTGEMFNRA